MDHSAAIDNIRRNSLPSAAAPAGAGGDHWTDRSALDLRRRLGLTSFVSGQDVERLLDYEVSAGLRVGFASDIDCRGEIIYRRGSWRLKLSDHLPPDEWQRVVSHEIAHRYTLSHLYERGLPVFSWWWYRRDERNAALWDAHFRMPSALLDSLVKRGLGWSELLQTCQAPEALLALKLRYLGYGEICPTPAGPAAPVRLASQEFPLIRIRKGPIYYGVGIARPATRESWVLKWAVETSRLETAAEEISWDLAGHSPEHFWERWSDRLKPLNIDRLLVRWSNPKSPPSGKPQPR